MTTAAARAQAEAILAQYQPITVSAPHAEGERLMALARIICELCDRIERQQWRPAEPV